MVRGRGRPKGSKDTRKRRRVGCIPDTASPTLSAIFLMADRKGFSREYLASRMNCSETTISHWRHGVHSPDILDTEALALIVGDGIEFKI